jgi:hypothetical protein
MREKITNLDTDNTQFSTMLMRLPSERAKSFKVEWMDDQLLPKFSALAASAASDLTNLTLTTSEGNYFKVGDILRNADMASRCGSPLSLLPRSRSCVQSTVPRLCHRPLRRC